MAKEWYCEWWREDLGAERPPTGWVIWPIASLFDLEEALREVHKFALHYTKNEWRIRHRKTGEIIMAMIL